MILVTGATGTIGRELVEQLVAMRQPIRVLVRDENKVMSLGDRVERVRGDLNHPETLDAAMDGIDQLFLVTVGPLHQDEAVLVAAKQAGVRHIVKLSTLEASDANIQVGKWSREKEQLIEASGIPWTFLRPGMFMSNLIGWWADSIKSRHAVFFPGGTGKVPPVAPHDVAAVAAASLVQPGHLHKAYELTGPALMTMGEMVETIARVLGAPIHYQDIPVSDAAVWMRKGGMDEKIVQALVELLDSIQKNEGAILTQTVGQVTGCPPQTLEAWCREHQTAFRQVTDVTHLRHTSERDFGDGIHRS